jgi:AraC family transcriptional regulator
MNPASSTPPVPRVAAHPLAHGQNFGDMTRTIATSDLVINAADHAPWMVVPTHEHANTYLCVVVSGAFELRARHRDECRAGSAIAYPAGHIHENRFGRQSSRCVNIHFGPTWTEERWVRDWLRDYHHVGVGPSAPSLRRLDRELCADDSAAPLATASAAIELLADALRADAPGGRPPWMSRIIDVVESDLACAPTLSQLAAEVGLHPAHVSRVFRKTCGETLGEYVRRRRVEEANRALCGDLSLAEIAAQAGFSDQAHFTRVFRRHFGISPGARRRAMRQAF